MPNKSKNVAITRNDIFKGVSQMLMVVVRFYYEKHYTLYFLFDLVSIFHSFFGHIFSVPFLATKYLQVKYRRTWSVFNHWDIAEYHGQIYITWFSPFIFWNIFQEWMTFWSLPRKWRLLAPHDTSGDRSYHFTHFTWCFVSHLSSTSLTNEFQCLFWNFIPKYVIEILATSWYTEQRSINIYVKT